LGGGYNPTVKWYLLRNIYLSLGTGRILRHDLRAIKENEVGGACSTRGEGEKNIQEFGEKAQIKRSLGRPRRRWEDGIRMDLGEIGWGMWSGFSWLRIGTGGGVF
jgi:hypothetical protein